MVFNLGYDRALWLLIASNKYDSDKIGNLISFIPDSVYNEIQVALNNYFNNCNDNKNNIIYQKNLNDIDGYDCYIKLKVNSNGLYFSVLRWIDCKNRVEEEYELILKQIWLEDLLDIKCGDKLSIGKYKADIYNISEYSGDLLVDNLQYSKKFMLTKIPFGFVINSSKDKIVNNMKYINVLKNMPDELFPCDFRSLEQRQGLIKKRKRIK